MLVLLYLLVGIITVFGAATAHLMSAEMKGYKALKWWDKNVSLSDVYNRQSVLKIIWGFIVWPIRLYRFWYEIPMYYELYERR